MGRPPFFLRCLLVFCLVWTIWSLFLFGCSSDRLAAPILHHQTCHKQERLAYEDNCCDFPCDRGGGAKYPIGVGTMAMIPLITAIVIGVIPEMVIGGSQDPSPELFYQPHPNVRLRGCQVWWEPLPRTE